MTMKKAVNVLSILLIAALLCGLFPAAYAEHKNETGALTEPVSAPAAEEASPAQEEPTLSREETMLNFLRLVMEAEAARDVKERAELCAEAEKLWNSYLESAPTGSTLFADELEADGQKLERQDMLFDLMQYIMAAETENDPAMRASYYLQADAIWYSYLTMINNAAETEKTEKAASDPERQEALEEFLRGVTDPEMDPAEQERFLKEAEKLWDTFYGMVLEAMEAGKPAAEEPETAAAPEEPAGADKAESETEPKDEPHVETYTFYTDNWDEFEDILSSFMNGAFPGNEDGTPTVGLPNPWIETKWLEEAELYSGVTLDLDTQALPEGMKLVTYRAMRGTIEADFSDGENELMIRASTEDEGFTLAGDYNSYSKEWTEKLGDLSVQCVGDGKTVNVACYKTDDVAVALSMACGLEGQGLTLDELKELVTELQAGAMRHFSPMTFYANPWNLFSDPFEALEDMYGGRETTDGQTDNEAPATDKTGTDRKPAPSNRGRGARRCGPGAFDGIFE